MANNIELRKQYTTNLDKKLKYSAVTSILDGDNGLLRDGANANEFQVPKLNTEKLGFYDKVNGYAKKNIEFTYETKKCDYDRSASFNIDAVDDEESAYLLSGNVAGEFLRVEVAPELDAYRLAKYAGTEGVGHAEAALTTGAAAIKALRVAATEMDDAEVPVEDRVLFITSTIKGMIDDLDTTASKKVMEGFSEVIKVPQNRFYTGINLTDNGYEKAEGAKNLNFLIVQKKATIQYQKHVAPKVISPEMNQTADAWNFSYRTVGMAEVYDNQVKGIYAHADVQ